MGIQTTSLVKLHIGPQNNVADDTTAYELLSYTEVADVEDLGDFGDTFEQVDFIALSDARKRKFKGSVDAGTLSVTLGLNVSDAGQAAVETARDATGATTSEFAFKVELNDTAGTNPTTYFFRALVNSYTQNVGAANSIVGSTVVLAINSAVRKLAAA